MEKQAPIQRAEDALPRSNAGGLPEFTANGLTLVNKPWGWTSFDVVAKIRSAIRRRIGSRIKVGHAGTLDPLATGLLLICTGSHTKLINTFQSMEKEYEAVLTLGATRPSYDKETEINATFPISHITPDLLHRTAKIFIGEIEQMPPIYSAIKVAGKRAYNIARRGKEVEMPTRKVMISELEITRIEMPKVHIRVVCSKGTYIRSLAQDFGLALGSGACLDALTRTRIGQYHLKDAVILQGA